MATPKATVDQSTWSITFTLDTPSDYRIIAKATDNALQLSLPFFATKGLSDGNISLQYLFFLILPRIYTSNLNGTGCQLFSVLPYLLHILASDKVAHRSLLSIKYKPGNPAVHMSSASTVTCYSYIAFS
jgi:hypothetical protein